MASEILLERKPQIDAALDALLPAESELPALLHRAMRYSVFAGGKRLRPILLIESAEALGCDAEKVLPAACAVECIHTYSLIHDDLPAMDNDDYRRGKATNHKVFGEDIAILAGDALLTHAFALLASHQIKYSPPEKVLSAIAELAAAAGSTGLVGGQVLDLRWQQLGGRNISFVETIHSRKTGALICSSVKIGALLAGSSEDQLQLLSSFGQKLGLAFQIKDDVLDIEGDELEVGKRLGKDAEQDKLTYPEVAGLPASRARCYDLLESAIRDIQFLGSRGERLCQLARFLIERTK